MAKVGKKVQIILCSSNSKKNFWLVSLSSEFFFDGNFFWFLAYCVYGGEAVEFCWGYCQFSGQECQVKVSISQENVGWRSKRRGKWQEWKWVEPIVWKYFGFNFLIRKFLILRIYFYIRILLSLTSNKTDFRCPFRLKKRL